MCSTTTRPRRTLTAALDTVGFAAGWERSVLVGEAAELSLPEPELGPVGRIASAAGTRTRGPDRPAPGPLGGPARRARRLVPGRRNPCVDPSWKGRRGLPRPSLRRFCPSKPFLVADADGKVRDALLAIEFREVTTARSHFWTPPGEPAVTPPARHSLYSGESERIGRRCEARVGFDYDSGRGRYRAPADSRSWFHGLLGGHDDPTIAAAEGVIERGLRACVRPGEWVYEYRPYLDGWEFDPHRVGGPGQPSWPGSAIAGGEFQFLATADARVGTFGHYVERTLVVFGEDLVVQVADDLERLLGDGTWTFGA
ncbi:DUF2716 domain-containing protein [Actinomadura parmotrematis]|uniref:DUF2716 domain-containing protein n=1 Tax=Actinomadura parmotrematis TaxID=2864039 RepID=A0ABS7FQE6_9ACTN|nr:DUF2716 domain-containing protein [Actinomadura parmotrematis]MBW8482623.1 DUF2716 domain-containing protein [Actinomadura parmotrematis]